MLPVLQAEQQLLAIEAATMPHLKPADQQATFRRYRQRISPAKRQTFADILLSGRVPNVRRIEVPKGGEPR